MDRILSGLNLFSGPFIVSWDHQSGTGIWSIKQPLSTVTTKARHGLVEPFLIELRGTEQRHIAGSSRKLQDPLGTVTAGGIHHGLVEPFLVQTNHTGGNRVRSVKQPLPTVLGSRGEWAICQPFIVEYYGHGGPQPVTDPLPTVTCRDRFALCEPFLLGQQSGATPRSVREPVPTVATSGAIALCEPEISHGRLGVRFRMLRPHELARAQGFPAGYKFTGNISEVVKQIGNAVPAGLSRALVRAALTQQP